MNEIDEIVSALSAPVSAWLNNDQQLKFERLVRIARDAVARADGVGTVLRGLEQEREALARDV